MNFLAFGILLAHLVWCIATLSPAFWVYLTIIAGYTAINFFKSTKYHNTFRRKMQIATWNDGGNPKVMGQVPVDLESIHEKMASKQLKNPSEIIPISVILGKGMALGVTTVKKVVGRLSLGNLLALPHVDISFQIQLEGGDVGYITIRDVDIKNLSQLAQEFKEKEAEIKAGNNSTHNLIRGIASVLPTFLFQFVIQILMWITHDMGVSLSIIGLPARPFGFLTVADIQHTGITDMYGTLNPLLKSTINVQICKPEPQVVNYKDSVVIRNTLNVGVVFDHRYADGADGAKIIRTYYDFLENLEKHLD